VAQVNIDGRRPDWRARVDEALGRGDHVSVFNVRDDFSFSTRCYNSESAGTVEVWNQGSISPCRCPMIYFPDGFSDCLDFTPRELSAALRERGDTAAATAVLRAKCRTTDAQRREVLFGSPQASACKCPRGTRGITLEMFLRSLDACAGKTRGEYPRGAEAFKPTSSYVQQSRIYFGLPVTGPNLNTAMPTKHVKPAPGGGTMQSTASSSGWGWLIFGGLVLGGVLLWKRSNKS